MNVNEYKIFCESFFKKDVFQSEESLFETIGKLSALEFKIWQTIIFTEYNEKQNFIREIINKIRISENFNVSEVGIDWDKDPIIKKEHQVFIHSYRDIYNNVINAELEKFKIYNQKNLELREYFVQEQYEKSLKITVDEKEFIAKKVIDVFWSGWECDDKAWLVNDNGENKIVVTDHGASYFTDKEFLINKIKEYEAAIKATQDMLNAL